MGSGRGHFQSAPQTSVETLERRICLASSLSGATILNLGAAEGSVRDVVHDRDREDLFRFRVASAGHVDLKLSNLGGDATLELIADRNRNNRLDSGEVVVRSSLKGLKEESVRKLLDAGWYHVRVSQARGGQYARYTLRHRYSPFATPDQRDSVGNTTTAATPINPARGSGVTINEHVGGGDSLDVYRWDLKARSGVTIRLSGLLRDADVSLVHDRNRNGRMDAGETVAGTTGKGLSNKLITGTLAAGCYFLQVSATSAATPYALRVLPSAPRSSDRVLTRSAMITGLAGAAGSRSSRFSTVPLAEHATEPVAL